MRNRTNPAVSTLSNDAATLSHETATTHSYLTLVLKGSQLEKIEELSLIMATQVDYILRRIEEGTADPDCAKLNSAIEIYHEAELKATYIRNGVVD